MLNNNLSSLYDAAEPSVGNRTDYDSVLKDNKFHIQHVLGDPLIDGEDTLRPIMQSYIRSTGYGYQLIIGNKLFAYRSWNGDDGISAWKKIIADTDINPVYKVLNLTLQFNSLGISYSLKMYGFVYIHLGFTTTRQPSEGDDIVQLIDTGDIAPVSTVAFTSRQGGYATFKIDSGSKNLRIGGTPPEANHTFIIDAVFKLI